MLMRNIPAHGDSLGGPISEPTGGPLPKPGRVRIAPIGPPKRSAFVGPIDELACPDAAFRHRDIEREARNLLAVDRRHQ